jgi:phosphoglycerate dehydrogenase-like enzyme
VIEGGQRKHRRSTLALRVLINTPAAGCSPAEWFPVTTEVEWVVETYIDNKPRPSTLAGVDVLVGTDFTTEMAKSSDRLKAICVPAAGVDRIDPAAVPAGCVVTNAYAHEAPIAEWVMACAVAMDHELLKAERTFRNGSWEMWPSRHGSYRELMGRTFGIIGFGAIGKRVAKLALAYDMKVIAAGRRPEQQAEAEAAGVEFKSGRAGLERVMAESDFVLVSTPLNRQTTGLIGDAELRLMKPTAFILNPARGHIVDEAALYAALKEKRIAGAAIDTWYEYPKSSDDQPRPASHPFWELDNVIMTPHASGATEGTRTRRAKVVAENIDRLNRGEPLLNVVAELSRP